MRICPFMDKKNKLDVLAYADHYLIADLSDVTLY